MQCSHNSLFLTHAQVLSRIPQPDEILRTFREFPPLKASGPDNIMLFYSKQIGPIWAQASFMLFKTFLRSLLSLRARVS